MVRTEDGPAPVWKWVAASLASLMIAGALILVPAYIALLRTPSRSEVEYIRTRQDAVLQRLAAIDERLATSTNDRVSIHEELDEIQTLIRELEAALAKHAAG